MIYHVDVRVCYTIRDLPPALATRARNLVVANAARSSRAPVCARIAAEQNKAARRARAEQGAMFAPSCSLRFDV